MNCFIIYFRVNSYCFFLIHPIQENLKKQKSVQIKNGLSVQIILNLKSQTHVLKVNK